MKKAKSDNKENAAKIARTQANRARRIKRHEKMMKAHAKKVRGLTRGAARAKRRRNMKQFREQQIARLARIKQSTTFVNAPSLDLRGFIEAK